MSYPYYDLVNRAHQELLAEGLIKARSSQEEVENDKGLICRRAAYYVYMERNPAHGLMEKTEGNNSMGYSVDWILSVTDGQGWDVTTDDGVNAFPVNGDSHGPNPDNIPRWRVPTKELAGITGNPVPGPEPEPPTNEEVLAKLDQIISMLPQMESRIITASDAGDQRTLDRLNSIIDQAEETLREILIIVLLRWDRNEPPPPAETDTLRVLLMKFLHSIRPPIEDSKRTGE